jgi:hypothetical protein
MANMNGDFDTGWDEDIWEALDFEEEDESDFTEEDRVDEEIDDIEEELYVQEYLSRRHDRGL